MANNDITFVKSILSAFAVYLLACGLSAIAYPKVWLWTAGLPTVVSSELGLVFGVLGVYLISLSIGAFIASRNPSLHRGVILILLLSQILDFLCTLNAVYAGSLPRLQGTVFLVATVVWSTVLSIAWRGTD